MHRFSPADESLWCLRTHWRNQNSKHVVQNALHAFQEFVRVRKSCHTGQHVYTYSSLDNQRAFSVVRCLEPRIANNAELEICKPYNQFSSVSQFSSIVHYFQMQFEVVTWYKRAAPAFSKLAKLPPCWHQVGTNEAQVAHSQQTCIESALRGLPNEAPSGAPTVNMHRICSLRLAQFGPKSYLGIIARCFLEFLWTALYGLRKK